MFDAYIGQGEGLRAIAARQGACLVAVVSHTERALEMSLLWSLCAALVDLGYPVSVLDACAAESAQNPGLDQLIDEDYFSPPSRLQSTAWTVIPSAWGFERLRCDVDQRKRSIRSLGRILRQRGVIVAYANASTLSSLFAGCGLEPLMVAPTSKSALISAYQGVKVLLSNGGLRPTMISMTPHGMNRPDAGLSPLCRSLQDCAQAYLGFQVDCLFASTPPNASQASDDMRRVALRVLESALVLSDATSPAPWAHAVPEREPVARSH